MEFHDTRILIADENSAGRAQLREALNRAGYRHIEEAGGGDDALSKIDRSHPDIAITVSMQAIKSDIDLNTKFFIIKYSYDNSI